MAIGLKVQKKLLQERKAEVKSQLFELGLLPQPLRLFDASPRQRFVPPDIPQVCAGLAQLGDVFVAFANYLGTRVDLFTLSDCLALHQTKAIASGTSMLPGKLPSWRTRFLDPMVQLIESEPNDQQAFSKLYYGELESGEQVVIKLTDVIDDGEFELLHLLEPIFSPFLSACKLFLQSVSDFQRNMTNQLDCRKVAERMVSLAQVAREDETFVVPKVFTELCTPHCLVTQRLKGVRLDKYITGTKIGSGPFYDGLDSFRGCIPEEVARCVCDVWLNLTLNWGISISGFEARDIIVLSPTQIGFLNVAYDELPKSTQNNVRKYLIHSCNDDPIRALTEIRRECQCDSPLSTQEIERNFRQLVPFRLGGWDDDGIVNSASETVFAQVRLLQELRIAPSQPVINSMQGLFCTMWLARQLSPVRDSFAEGIKDLRFSSLLQNAREILDPVHWTSQTDKLIGLMMFGPKHFEEAIENLTSPSAEPNDVTNSGGAELALLKLLFFGIIVYIFSTHIGPWIGEVMKMWNDGFWKLITWG